MSELADIFRQYGDQYCAQFDKPIPLSHRLAMQAIMNCRTEVLGGHQYVCDHCEQSLYSYHSCKNRHCPKCQNDQAEQWLARQQALLLPTDYFMITFTLPAELRPLAQRHPQIIYQHLFRTAATALQELAKDKRFIDGQIGMIGILHTWTRDLRYHPHVHFLVPGGGITADEKTWRSARNKFFVHVKPLAKLFRAKFRDALKKTDLFDLLPTQTWSRQWVVHSKQVGQGFAALKYLAPYVFRVAISNNRIISCQNDQVTFRYQSSDTGQTQYCTLPALKFIGRFLQHVLPKGFMKIRYYGFYAPSKRPLLQTIRHLLRAPLVNPLPATDDDPANIALPANRSFPCPHCGQDMHHHQVLRPVPKRPVTKRPP